MPIQCTPANRGAFCWQRQFAPIKHPIHETITMHAEHPDVIAEPKQKQNGAKKATPRVISNPSDVAGMVFMQIDAINTKKDELTIAVKGLADTAKQLVRAYAQQAEIIQKLTERVKELESCICKET